MVANREQRIRELAERMGLDPDRAWAEAQAPKIELTCPVCGQPATMSIQCRGCGGDAFAEYGNAELAAARRHILDLPVGTPEARKYAAEHAFGPGGCMVCADCIEQTLSNDAICPLLWIISPRTGLNHLGLAQAQNDDPEDEYRRIFDLWANVLAAGDAAEWRTQLFNQAIPNALQAYTEQFRAEDGELGSMNLGS
jgi:hypothetical protein